MKPKFNKMIFNPESASYVSLVVLENHVYFEGLIESEEGLRTQKFVLSHPAAESLFKLIAEFKEQAI